MYKYTEIEHESDMLNDMIDREMYKIRDQVLERLKSDFVHPTVSIKSLSLTIAYGYFESIEDAEIVADQLNLCKLDFLAIREDFEAFKEEYLKELELAQNF